MMKSQFNDEQRLICAQIEQRLDDISSRLEEACAACGRSRKEITVMAVTKTVDPIYVNHAVTYGGLKLLGENRAQELCEKYEAYLLKKEQIHFIGHLQTNKVRQIIDKVSMIQSVDSMKLAAEIDRQAAKLGRRMDILVEVNIGGEESKSGVIPAELPELLDRLRELDNLRVRGLMAIPPRENAEYHFAAMQELYEACRQRNDAEPSMDTLSLGMSADYLLAVKYGTTMVRLGSAIFGPRNIPIK